MGAGSARAQRAGGCGGGRRGVGGHGGARRRGRRVRRPGGLCRRLRGSGCRSPRHALPGRTVAGVGGGRPAARTPSGGGAAHHLGSFRRRDTEPWMRIALISREHPSKTSGGGIGTYTMTMGAALVRLGHEVTVLTRGCEEPRLEDGVRVISLRHRGLPSSTAERLAAARRNARGAVGADAQVVQAAEWEADAWWLARR